MKAIPKPLSKLLHLLAVLVIIVLASTACASAGPQAGESTPAEEHTHEDDHAHEAETPEDHAHEEDAGDHEHPGGEGSTTVGDSEVKIDHHGNPVFDEEERVYEQTVQEGVSVEFTVENFLGVGGRGGELAPRIVEGEMAVLQFHVTDFVTGAPLEGMRPAVWLDLDKGDDSEAACRAQVEGYLGGTLDARPVVDLNSYFILGMNKDSTISVIDPMVDVAGMTNLFAVMLLQGNAEDWVLTADQMKLYITIPSLQKVGIADMDALSVEKYIEFSGAPVRIALQPDERYAWAGIESDDPQASGIAAVETRGMELAAEIATGAGPHAFAFSPDSRYVYVTNGGDGTLSIIDTGSLEVAASLDLGPNPSAVAVAPDTGMVYVTDQELGLVSVVDPERMAEVARMVADPGVGAVAVSPDGQWGFAANPDAQKLYVIEMAQTRITHAVPVNGAPDQVTFSEQAAYFRSRSTAAVFVIPLTEIDPQGNVSVLTIPVGTLPPNRTTEDSVADAVISTPDGRAMLIANPADDKIYFYTEGAESTLGGYQGHTLVPRAVKIVDRSLKERSPGVYTGAVRVPRSGDFTAAFLMDSPQVVHCFHFTAKPNPDLPTSTAQQKIKLTVLNENPNPTAGSEFKLQIQLTDENTGEILADFEGLTFLARVLAGNWSQRGQAANLGNGTYEMGLVFPNPGYYTLLFGAPGAGVDFDKIPQLTLQVVP